MRAVSFVAVIAAHFIASTVGSAVPGYVRTELWLDNLVFTNLKLHYSTVDLAISKLAKVARALEDATPVSAVLFDVDVGILLILPVFDLLALGPR